MLVGLNICLRILEAEYKNHFVIMCPKIVDNNKIYLSRKQIFDVFIVFYVEGKFNEWIKLFRNTLKFCQTCLSLTIALQKVK